NAMQKGHRRCVVIYDPCIYIFTAYTVLVYKSNFGIVHHIGKCATLSCIVMPKVKRHLHISVQVLFVQSAVLFEYFTHTNKWIRCTFLQIVVIDFILSE